VAAWNFLVGLNTAFALRAVPALWQAKRAWSSPMTSSSAAVKLEATKAFWLLRSEIDKKPFLFDAKVA
jgi:hypothetical protein